MSWVRGSVKPNTPAAIWWWQYQSGAYWLLLEVDGYSMDDWAYDHAGNDWIKMSAAMRKLSSDYTLRSKDFGLIGKIRACLRRLKW